MKHLIPMLWLSIVVAGCDRKVETVAIPRHVLVGGWKADDATIFVYRNDGTFHGVDWRQREIWGNWVKLSDERIGFQSLMHASYYNPQYAIVGKSDANRMDYIISDGTRFISATRIEAEEAEVLINASTQQSVHKPGETDPIPPKAE